MSSRSLITRLRRHTVMPWLLTLLLLMKTVVATACITDGLFGIGEGNGSSTVAAVTVPDSLTSDTAADGLSDCWHSGNGGCHCFCAHSAALPVSVHIHFTAYPFTELRPSLTVPLLTALYERNLRPPII